MLALKVLFWLCLFIVFYTYLGYGILLYLIIRIKRLVKGRPVPTPMPSDEELPTMTLMICAYNEQDVVAEKMENTRALDYPKDKFRVMWVTDGSNDRTNELLAAYPEVDIVYSPERRGKTAGYKPNEGQGALTFTAERSSNERRRSGSTRRDNEQLESRREDRETDTRTV